jgi:hypothetical protein
MHTHTLTIILHSQFTMPHTLTNTLPLTHTHNALSPTHTLTRTHNTLPHTHTLPHTTLELIMHVGSKVHDIVLRISSTDILPLKHTHTQYALPHTHTLSHPHPQDTLYLSLSLPHTH